MVAYESILETYHAMSVKSGQMVEAAQQGDWDRLAVLEGECSALIGAMKRVAANDDSASHRPDAAYVRRKVTLMRKVLADDAEIRRHTEPWMTRLQSYLGSTSREPSLQCAYNGGCAG